MAYITRRERFNAAHRLYNKELTDEENLTIYGKCSHPNWHGHNFDLFVTIKGEIDSKTGFVTNLNNISKLIKELVIEKLDHRNINLDVDFMRGKIASTENLAIAIWGELKNPIETIGVGLHCVKIQETENNWVEYFGD
ncbi:MAG TPA: 6-pyruvoyl tetrahydrobiopterin synthase [Bacteroidales bacterium]|nr:6-pyruvoyl tetrahydrobiopterin synthase [Bacteroidales bacterium]